MWVVLAVVAWMMTASQPTQHMLSLLYSIRMKPFSPQSYQYSGDTVSCNSRIVRSASLACQMGKPQLQQVH